MRHFLAALVLMLALATWAPAQVFIPPCPTPGWNPWQGGVIYPPQNPGIQYLGQLPNGIQVFNPWNMYQNLNNQRPIYYTQPYVPLYLYPNYNNGYGAYSPYTNGSNGYNAGVQQLPGRFIPVGFDLAVNPIAGVQLAPYRGVAVTSEGTFYRAAGTGSFTAWGAFLPGSGAYVNPVNGDVYQPGSGIIIRR